MTRIIGPRGGYRKTFSFGFACLIYHATTAFCRKNYDYHNDSLGKTTGQMVGAARSARQNLVEGSSRAGTSRETELRLIDVAKGSLEELAGDYEAFLADCGEAPWSAADARAVNSRRFGWIALRRATMRVMNTDSTSLKCASASPRGWRTTMRVSPRTRYCWR